MRVGIYARVSTHDQQTLPMQLSQMKDYIEHRNWTLTVEVEEVGSGAKTRPKREELVNMARRREIDAILVWKLDRFGRSFADLITTLNELRELGVIFVSITEALDFSTPSGRAMAGMLSTFAEFERDMIRERVKAGIANAREKGKPHGRPKTASNKLDKILELKSEGLNNSQIAKKLKISRGSVIGLLKGQTIPTPKIKPETAIITLWLRVENNSKFVRGKGQVRERIEQDSLREYQMKKLSNNEYELIFIYIGMMKTCKNKLTNCTGKCFRQPIYETVLSKPISMKKAWSVPFNNNLRIDREGTFQKRISQNCKMCVATSHCLCYDDASEVMLICQ